MKRNFLILTALVAVVAPSAMAQEVINGSRQILGGWDASGAASTKPDKIGTLAGLPPTCGIGQTYFASDVPALEFCVATNSWRPFAWNGSFSPAADAPTFTPVGGTYTSTRTVTMASTTAGATICYTIDNTDITVITPGTCPGGSTTYSTALTVATTTTGKAVATKAGFTASTQTNATYTISGGAGSPVLVSHVKARGNTTSAGIITTGATSLVVGVCAYQVDTAGAGIVTDSNSNTWVAGTRRGAANTYNCTNWTVVSSPIVGAGHTFTVTTATASLNFYVMAFSGTTTFDQQNGATSGNNTAPFAGAPVTPSADNEVVISLLGVGWGGGWTPAVTSAGPAWSVTDFETSGLVQGGMAYQIQSTATAVTTSWSGAAWAGTPAIISNITIKSN